MISELGIGGIMVVICTTVFAISWILLPFLVSAVYRSTSNCNRELRALNRRIDLIISKIFFESKEAKELSSHETINSTTTDGKVTWNFVYVCSRHRASWCSHAEPTEARRVGKSTKQRVTREKWSRNPQRIAAFLAAFLALQAAGARPLHTDSSVNQSNCAKASREFTR